MTSELVQPVELWDVDALIPYAKNAKLHDEKQVAKLAESIRKFRWTQPIVIDADGVIIIGHGRRLAALKLGLKKVPVIVRRDLDAAGVMALRLADNRVTSTSYDNDLIKESLRELSEISLEDLFFTGFEQQELDMFMEGAGEVDLTAFVPDIVEAVEKQKSENAEIARSVDDEASPVSDALGFKHVTVAQSRKIRAHMRRIETETGLSGADAFIAYLDAAA